MKIFIDAGHNPQKWDTGAEANGYYEKGVLSEEDLAELQSMIDEKNKPTEEITEEQLTEV